MLEIGQGAHRRRPGPLDVPHGKTKQQVRGAVIAGDAVDIELLLRHSRRHLQHFGHRPGDEVVGKRQADVAQSVMKIANVGAVLV